MSVGVVPQSCAVTLFGALVASAQPGDAVMVEGEGLRRMAFHCFPLLSIGVLWFPLVCYRLSLFSYIVFLGSSQLLIVVFSLCSSVLLILRVGSPGAQVWCTSVGGPPSKGNAWRWRSSWKPATWNAWRGMVRRRP